MCGVVVPIPTLSCANATKDDAISAIIIGINLMDGAIIKREDREINFYRSLMKFVLPKEVRLRSLFTFEALNPIECFHI